MNSTILAETIKRLGPAPEIHKIRQPDLFSFVSDDVLALMVPVVLYWTYSAFFHFIDVNQIWEKYRLHTPEELSSRNKVSILEVMRAVIQQHVAQTLAGLFVIYISDPVYTGHEDFEIWDLARRFGISLKLAGILYTYAIPASKIFGAILIMDTWQYSIHRLMHINKFLYKHLHSVHHRLYVPYAFGALYNSLLEALLLDTLGAGLSDLLMGLRPRESMFFYAFSTLKTVDDHCGYKLPFDPFQLMFPNNAAYHDIHHQRFGIKTNFSQPFFVHWDLLFKTSYPKYQEYITEQERKRQENYSKHLEEKAKKAQKQD